MPPNDSDDEDEVQVGASGGDDDDDLVDWIQCDRCKHFLHTDCVFGAHASSAELAEQKFICVLCDDENNNNKKKKDKNDQEKFVDENRPENVVLVADDVVDFVAPNKQPRRRRRYFVCSIDGCDYSARSRANVLSHRQWGHPDRAGDKEDPPPSTIVAFAAPPASCRCCGIKLPVWNGLYFRHFNQCIKKNPIRQFERQPPVPDSAETPQPEQPRKRARTTAVVAQNVSNEASVTAFPPSAARVIGSAASVALEKARRGVLLRKIRAVIELDEAFLQTMNANYASHKLSNEVNEQQ
jgi:hypothetical protein